MKGNGQRLITTDRVCVRIFLISSLITIEMQSNERSASPLEANDRLRLHHAFLEVSQSASALPHDNQANPFELTHHTLTIAERFNININ